MTYTVIGIIITALAIEADKYSLFKHPSLPVMALVGVLIVILSLVPRLSVS